MSEKLNLNQKFKNLDEKIEWFYSDEFKIEDAMDNYQSTVKLAKELEKDLDGIKNKIEIINKDFSK